MSSNPTGEAGQPGKELVHGEKRKWQGAEAKNNRRRRLVGNPNETVVGFAESSNSGEDIEEGDVSHSEGEDEMDDEDEDLLFGLELDEEDEEEEDSDAYDEFEEFTWLKSIKISVKAEDSYNALQIGYCHAKLIDRDRIRGTFYRDMEEPTKDLCELAFGLFDRWGNLKSELRNHPIKKGTGVWGEELDEGKFLLIEEFTIDENHRRKGYGRKLMEQTWAKAQEIAPDCKFAFAWATYLCTRDVEDRGKKLSPKDQELFYQGLQKSGEDFWRAIGFRRIGSSPYFCMASDSTHPSHSLSPKDDYRRPLVLRASPNAPDQQFPYDITIAKANDANTLNLLKARLSTHPATSPVWHSHDRHGNTIMHVVAHDGKAESLAWVLSMPFAAEAKASRNLEGETPLECLEAGLESGRLKRQAGFMTVPVSDCFSGFAPNDVECLRLLKGIESPSPHQLAQLTYGCTCGQCLEGFMSPRVAFALLCQGELLQDMLDGVLANGSKRMSTFEWFEYFDYTLEHLTPGVREIMQTNKSIRQGFTNILGYVAETLGTKKTPITPNILELAASEWPPCTKNFIQRGGTVAAVVLACFDCAIDQDLYLGNGHHHEGFSEDIGELPACRNDGEFAFACRRYRALEGLPPAVNPRVGMGGLW